MEKRNLYDVDTIVVHCTATPAGRDYTLSQIDDMHRKQGWEGCGYHYLIHLDGRIEEARPLDCVGAHVRHHNAHTIGVAYVGGVLSNGRPADTRTDEQKTALARLIWRLSYKWISEGYGLLHVRGHRDFNRNKACPCFDAKKEYD